MVARDKDAQLVDDGDNDVDVDLDGDGDIDLDLGSPVEPSYGVR